MKTNDIELENTYRYEFIFTQKSNYFIKEKTLKIKSIDSKQYLLIQGRRCLSIELKKTVDKNQLDLDLNRCAYLITIDNVTNNEIILKFDFFNGNEVIWPCDLEFVVSEKVDNDIKAYKKDSKLNSSGVTEFLRKSLLIENIFYEKDDDNINNEINSNSNKTTLNEDKFLRKYYFLANFYNEEEKNLNTVKSFCLCCDKFKLWIKKTTIGEKAFLEAFKIQFYDKKNNDSIDKESLKLVISTNFYFKNLNDARGLSKEVQEQLNIIMKKNDDSYLKAWDSYSEIEGNLLLEKARKIGVLEYKYVEDSSKGKVYSILKQKIPKDLSEGDGVEFCNGGSLPLYIQDPKISYKEFLEKTRNQNSNNSYQTGTILKIDRNYGTLEIDVKSVNQKEGNLIFSIKGDSVQLKRREKAKNLILKGKSANPQLGMILESGAQIIQTSSAKRNKIDPISQKVNDKIFKIHPPTEIQRRAIEIALNTPDIALIQGPPGTGKTTVINAIIERLNEIMDVRKPMGSILVSGFQHDAVNNIVERLDVNSLPTIKFGAKRNLSLREANLRIENWSNLTVEKIRNKYPELKKSEKLKNYELLMCNYQAYPSTENESSLLSFLLSLPRDYFENDEDYSFILDRKAQVSVSSEGKENNRKLADYRRIVYSLRVNLDSFLDDGYENALMVSMYLPKDMLSDKDREILKIPVDPSSPYLSEYFSNVKRIRKSLLMSLNQKNEFSRPHSNIRLTNLANSIYKKIKNEKSLDFDSKMQILSDFIFELENNPESVIQTIADSNVVFAATVQQSVGNDILQAKTRVKDASFEDDDSIKDKSYNTVIIDEAARSTPLDLLIPMSLGRERIILVGDHKQLPHIIDDEVAKKLESQDENKNVDIDSILRKSMFAYLFKRLKELEKQDHICRTVTLDAQYRTHPDLGNLVSNSFYEGKVSSPLPEKYFAQNLPKVSGKAAVWIDVPQSMGYEGKQGTSRIRECEAQIIAKYLKEWLSCDEGRKLSFGVISFYKAQADLIEKEVRKLGLFKNDTDLDDDFKGEIVNGERLRINTVDSFQGMEFDVVLLSMVRSRNFNDLDEKFKKKNEESQMRSLYGHLMSENRLCVSLSRQKKLLIVVGDKSMLECEIGCKAVPALASFLDLAKNKGAIL